MAIAIEQSFCDTFNLPSGSVTTTSWAPQANELCLCLVANRGTGAVANHNTGVSGNGLTWVKILEKDDTQNAVTITMWRAMGASPSAGGVTVTLGLDPFNMGVHMIRLSGINTTGVNGADAIGATASAETGATDTTPATTSLTTTRDNSMVIGLVSHRNQVETVGSGYTALHINQSVGSGGSVGRSGSEYKVVASSGTLTTVDFTLDAAGDWVIAALEILTPGGTTYNQAASGSIAISGTLVTNKTTLQTLSGSVGSSGALATLKSVTQILSGSVGSSGAVAKAITHTLSGTISPSGHLLSGSSADARNVPKPRRGSIFSQDKLAFLVSAPAWSNAGFLGDYSQDVTSYSHTHAAIGGFWSANLSMQLPLHDLEEWIEYGVGRQIQVKGRGAKLVWEGIVSRVSINVGGYNMTIGPYLDIANKVKLTYSIFLQLGGGNATGIRVSTAFINNTLSQGRYGILEKNFSVGGIDTSSVDDLQSMLLDRYSQPPRSEDLSLPGDTGLTYFDMKLECIGYAHLFQKYIYNNATIGTQNLSAKLAAIITAEPNALFTSTLETNTIQVPTYENDDNEAWGLIKALVATGDTSLNRYTFGVYENRRATYKAVDNRIIYIRPLREGASVIQDALGGLLQAWEIRPGVYVMVTDLLPGKPVAADLSTDRRAIFADTVQYQMPDSLVINGSTIFKVDQRLAQLGLSGVS